MADTAPTIEKRDNVTCILLGEEFENLDEQILESIRGLMLETAADADPPRIVVDLPYTKFFGSSFIEVLFRVCLLYTSPSPRDLWISRMPSSA